MSPVVFWVAFPAAILFALMLSALPAPAHKAVLVALAALVWLGAFSLAWHRWVRRPAPWLGQLAAAIGALLLIALVHEWWLRTDVFVVYRRNCPPRTGTFWPLLFVWLGGIGLQTFALWGKAFRPASIRTWTMPRTFAWWCLLVAWTTACAWVFAHNINAAAFGQSLLVAGKLIGTLALIAGAIGGLLWLATMGSRKAQKQVAADYAKLDPTARSEILESIDRHARSGAFRLIFRPVEGIEPEVSMARIGGRPSMRTGEDWPRAEDGNPAAFLLQLPMASLPAPWNERLVAVYLTQHELLVRSHDDIAALRPMPAPVTSPEIVPCALQALAVPITSTEPGDKDDADEYDDWDLASLIDVVPGLAQRLAQVTTHPTRVLAKVLTGCDDAGHFEAEDAIVVGGTPLLIQGAHDPVCAICSRPLRFLFQFGDITESYELGDAGVGYVYGCDRHPEHCLGFVDCH